MTVSIIIAIKELNDNLKECLKHCLNLNYPDYEIIVFPDKQFFYLDKKVRIIPTGQISPPKKRDLALKESRAEILAFIDDDAYPDRSWLDKALPNFKANDVAAVGGPAITPAEDSLRQKASGAVFESILVSGPNCFRYKQESRRFINDYPSCNFIIRRPVFQELGGFKVDFWPGEDTFLCLEITKKLNKKIIYDPEVLVYHHRRQLFLPHLKQVANYALHRGYFAKRFPQNSLKLSYFIPSIFLSFVFLGGIVAFYYHKFSYLYFLGMLTYLFLVLIFSFSRDLRMIFLKFFGIITTHLTYGFFFLKGLNSNKLAEENESNNFLPTA